MPQAEIHGSSLHLASAAAHDDLHMHGPSLWCGQCRAALECVDQSRRTGTWLGTFMCPNCRSEYFYAYRWGRLTPKW